MKIALFNVAGRMSSDGSRLISALLKRAGHDVKSIFLARREPLGYERAELECVSEILKESDLAMIAVTSSYSIRAVQVTDYIRKKYPGMQVIWGGPHCISVPELGLRYADGVCFSEGDQVIVEVVNKMEKGINYLDTPNMAFKVNGSNVVNNVLPPFSDLDSLPYYDYDLENQFLLDRSLIEMTKERLRERLYSYPYDIPILYFVTSRGCPHSCAYCNNCRYVSMFGSNTMRFYSVDRILQELQYDLECFDFYRIVAFADDDFFMRPENQLAEFAEKYKKKIGLPFGVAISANTFQRNKVEKLLDAGLRLIQLGVQSGSQRILDDIYHRRIKISKTKDVIRQLETYCQTHSLDVLVDFIIDNPYETKEDIAKTYEYILDMPLCVRANVFFLAFFPGTPIYERALNDGIIQPFDTTGSRFYTRSSIQYQENYETFLVLLLRAARRRIGPQRDLFRSVMKTLGSRAVRSFASIFPGVLYVYLSRFTR